MPEREKLKNCPFCGCEVQYDEYYGHISCMDSPDDNKCSFYFTCEDGLTKEVIKQWNTREPLSEVVDIDKLADSCMYDFPKSYSNSQILAYQKGIDKIWSKFKKQSKKT